MILGITIMIAGPILVYLSWRDKTTKAYYTIPAAIAAALAFFFFGFMIMCYELGWPIDLIWQFWQVKYEGGSTVG